VVKKITALLFHGRERKPFLFIFKTAGPSGNEGRKLNFCQADSRGVFVIVK